jgi:GntR family transcriptional regulator
VTRKSGAAESAYVVLARSLRDDLLKQQYADGRALPTEAQLAVLHGVSRQTVRRAFQDLVSERMVYRVPGRGTFAAPRDGQYLRQFGSIEDLMSLSIDTKMRIVRPLAPGINISAASRLRLPSDSVASVAFVREHDEVPFCLTTVYLEPSIGRMLETEAALAEAGRRSSSTIIGLLDAHLNSPISEADQSITAVPAPRDIAELLSCAEAAPLLRIDRVYYDSRGAPRELATSYFLPEHYSYRVRLRRNVS